MKNGKVYLSFQTDVATSKILKKIADDMGKTQPQLIDEVCKDFIKELLLDQIEKELTENGKKE